MKKIYILICLCFFAVYGYSQKENGIWYFGEYAGLDFNRGVPVSLNDGELSTIEGCATISDSDGNLLFYSDGSTVWNRNHTIMPNGSGLKGHFSSSQSCIVVPKPNSSNIYYLFTVGDKVSENGLLYNVVDMTLDSGLGDITKKNIFLTKAHERLTSVHHSNGNDIWVISHRMYTNIFTAYLIKNSGIANTPVTSSVGMRMSNLGIIKVSPNGKLIAVTNSSDVDRKAPLNGAAQLLSFNSTTGVIDNPIDLSSSINIPSDSPAANREGIENWAYGLEFSLDSSKLYITSRLAGVLNSIPNHSYIYQFDFKSLSSNDIKNSVILVVKEKNIFGQLQLAIDGKIYITRSNENHLSVINTPNAKGFSCNFKLNGVFLKGGESRIGLPSFIQSNFIRGFSTDNLCYGTPTQFKLNTTEPVSSVIWQFGDGSDISTQHEPTHTYNQPGDYIVNAIVTLESGKLTETRAITINEIPIAHPVDDLYICYSENGMVADLSKKENEVLGNQSKNKFNVTYYSSFSDAEIAENAIPRLFANPNFIETVYARVTNVNDLGCYDITDFNLKYLPKMEIKDSYDVCANNINFTLNGGDYQSWIWENDNGDIISTSQSIQIKNAGTYNLTATYNDDTVCEKTFKVTPLNLPEGFTVDVSGFSQRITLTVSTTNIGEFEYSLDGENFQPTNVFRVLPGEYTVYIRDTSECKTLSTKVIAFGYLPFFTPNEDGKNDKWHIIGKEKFSNSVVYIYDRYGKLLKQLTVNSSGWDGTFNGKKLHSSDYWFRYVYDQGKEQIGHFSLKR